jgi:hypothetical protein
VIREQWGVYRILASGKFHTDATGSTVWRRTVQYPILSESRRTNMLRIKKSKNFDRVASTRTDKKLIALAWVIACTIFFLMMRAK